MNLNDITLDAKKLVELRMLLKFPLIDNNYILFFLGFQIPQKRLSNFINF